MKKILIIGVSLICLFLPAVAFAQDSCQPANPCETVSPAPSIKDKVKPQFLGQKVCVYYFWGAGCQNCEKISPLINKLEKNYNDKAEFKKFEIYFDKDNQELFFDFSRRYKVGSPGVPATFLGDIYLGGGAAIEKNLEGKINELYKNVEKVICPLDYNRVETDNLEKPKNLSLTLPVVVLAALADSINPCAFSVLIFLLVYLLAIKARLKIIKVGLTYIVTIFFVYFLAGLGILKVFSFLGFAQWITKTAGLLAIFAGLINIKDFFWQGRGISLQIPEDKKPLIEKFIKKASMPAAFILGILVSAFELPCTGGIYLAILSLLGKSKIFALPYLLLYNLVFVLPLFLILLLVYKGISPEKMEKIRKGKRNWLRLAMGLMMVVLGVGLLLEIF